MVREAVIFILEALLDKLKKEESGEQEAKPTQDKYIDHFPDLTDDELREKINRDYKAVKPISTGEPLCNT